MSEGLRLTYLDVPGYAESIRLALCIGDIPFEDERISYEEVQKRRQEGKLPFGQVPVLHVDGKLFSQSAGILRWAGRQSGLYDDERALACDEIEEAMNDIRIALRPQWYGAALGRDPTSGEPLVELSDSQKEETLELLCSRVLPTRLQMLEVRLGTKDYFCGDQLSTCDLSWYVMCTGLQEGWYCSKVPPSVLDGCPNLVKVAKRVAEHPKVLKWNEEHSKKSE